MRKARAIERYRRKREVEISQITAVLAKITQNRFELNPNFHSLFQLISAGGTYIHGYYIASIFHSGLSLELALVTALDRKLCMKRKKDRKFALKLWKYNNLVQECYERKILDEEHRDLAIEIFQLRGLYVHFANFVTISSKSYDVRKIIESKLEDLEPSLRKFIEDLFETHGEAYKLPRLDLDWVSGLSKERMKLYGERIKSRLEDIYVKYKEGKIETKEQFLEELDIPRLDALDILNSTFRIFEFLKIF